MRLLICAGGTGGGVYPALAVLQTMRDKTEVLWVGGEGGMEARLLERENVAFKTIPAAGVHGVSMKSLPGNLIRLVRGYFASRSILRDFQPDGLFFTGGYLAVPMALAGAKLPSLLFVPDIEPALALSILARFARQIAVVVDDSIQYYRRSQRIVVTGYPTRPALAGWAQQDARRKLGLQTNVPVLLVVGGSKGARSINEAVLENLPEMLERIQVVHVTGELQHQDVNDRVSQLTSCRLDRYHAFPYLHENMGAALAAADLVVSRSGASTLGEYPLFGLPAILVPYPYAWRYQKVNAAFLEKCGAAVVLEDGSLSKNLLPAVMNLLSQPRRLAAMRAAMQGLSHPKAAEEIGSQILALCGGRS